MWRVLFLTDEPHTYGTGPAPLIARTARRRIRTTAQPLCRERKVLNAGRYAKETRRREEEAWRHLREQVDIARHHACYCALVIGRAILCTRVRDANSS